MSSYPTGTPEERFWAKVSKASGHWLWTGYINARGYAMFHPDHRAPPTQAHRFAWLLSGRNLSPGRYVANTCGIRSCVKPEHHKEITSSESWRHRAHG